MCEENICQQGKEITTKARLSLSLLWKLQWAKRAKQGDNEREVRPCQNIARFCFKLDRHTATYLHFQGRASSQKLPDVGNAVGFGSRVLAVLSTHTHEINI